MQHLWGTNKDCYVGKHNLEPESICSILIYLSEVCKTSTYKLSWMLFAYNKSSDTCKNYVSPYSASKLLLIDNVSNGCCGSQAKFEPYHSKTAQEYQQRYCLTDYVMTQCCINETCFLGETSTCRQGRVEIECMKIEQFENASLHFNVDRKKN